MKKLITIATIVLAVSCLTQASVIVKYDFGDYPNDNLDPSLEDEHITASVFGYSGDGDTDFTWQSGNGEAYQVNGGWPHDEYEDYFHFTIEIESGWSLDLDDQSIWFDADTSTMSGPYECQVTYDNPEIPLGSELNIASSGWWTWKTYQSDPSTGLTGNVEFRIYGKDATDGGIFSIDNVILNGTTAQIPEPTTIAILGLGALALRRKQKV